MVNINTGRRKTKHTPTLPELRPYQTATQYNISKPLTWDHAQLVVNDYGCNAETLPVGWAKLKEMIDATN